MTPLPTARRGGLAEAILGTPVPGPWHAQLRAVTRDIALAVGYAACALALAALALLITWLAVYTAVRVTGIA